MEIDLNEKEKQNLTEDEQEIARARKLELLILPILRRNMKFFYAGGNLQDKAKAYREQIDINEIEQALQNKEKNIAIVCKPLCEAVSKILSENGLKAETVSCDTDMFKHTDVLITTGSGKKYIINYLEDMENIQSGMRTPDFASKAYYERRYAKFEDGITTDGKDINGIDFLTPEQLYKIDSNLGYTKGSIYMDDIISIIKTEFSEFRPIIAEYEFYNKKSEVETLEEQEKLKKDIISKYSNITPDEELELKIDWIFDSFNHKTDIKGHADFVMYYSRLILKEVLSEEEYKKITRYDCFANPDNVPEDSKLQEILDYDNPDYKMKSRFCMLEVGDKMYAFSTKENSYIKFDKSELGEMQQYANISKSEKPSDLMIYLCDRGNALPLVFHPLGSKILNERAELIDKNLSSTERRNAIKDLSDNIKTTDEPITSILIPYPNGDKKYIYINSNDEFVVKSKNKETIYHYNEIDDTFTEEVFDGEER